MKKIETKLAQLGNRKDKVTGAIVTPIYLSTAYAHPGLGESTGYDYTRTKNPTRTILEEGLCELEEGCSAIATSSGMSAIQLVFELFDLNSEFLVSRDLYGGSFRYFDELERKGAQKFIYFTDEKDLEDKITDNTKAVFIETPTNPLMQEVDIEKVAQISKSKNALLIVDNTLLTPLRQKPLALGADIVVHSATKYLTGHNDILAGAVITNDEQIGERLAWISNTTGAVLSAFDSWLFVRSLKTLPLRFNQQEKNARMERKISDKDCPVRKSMQIFAGKWTLLIIFQINRRTIRYGELKRAIPNISEKILIDELKFLCNKGLVKKEQYPEVPPRVEYSLTELGEKVLPIIDEIAKFGMENL